MNRLLRPAIPRADLKLIVLGAYATVVMTTLAARLGSVLTLGLLVTVLVFFAAVAAFVVVPHVAVAVTIPIFVLLPMVKVLLVPSAGPLKDLITIGAISAAAILAVQRSTAGMRQRGDVWVAAGVGVFCGLYLVNLGGLQWDVAWAHGMRLTAEPLALLLVGLTLDNPRRTLRWAIGSLIVTAVVVALIGLFQQVVGMSRLYDYGYEFDRQLRTFGGRLRSFGPLDDPFAYAAYLLISLAAVILWVRNAFLAVPVGALLVVGVAASYVRTALLIGLGLLGLWLARRRYTTTSIFVVTVAVVVALGALVLSNASKERTVRTNDATVLTVNGRTEAWKLFLDDPEVWAIGHGVGQVGTAAERATYTVDFEQDNTEEGRAVDSGYFAVIADVGLVGLVFFLGIFGRLLALGIGGARRGSSAAWLAIGLVVVILLDAVTRASFTGFPTAFLGLLLVGIALAAAQDEQARLPSANGRPAS